MKKKLPLVQEIYLPEYLSGTAARSFDKELDQRILYWDFGKALDKKTKDADRITSESDRKSNKESRRETKQVLASAQVPVLLC